MKAAAAAAVGGGEGGGGKKGQALKVLAERAAFWLRRPLFSARARAVAKTKTILQNKRQNCLLPSSSAPFTLYVSHSFALALSFSLFSRPLHFFFAFPLYRAGVSYMIKK